MLITDKFIFFELQKTGCSHTKEILKTLSLDGYKNIGVHNFYSSISSEDLGDFENKLKIGNIRNPWDWYVSLWSYGSMKRGRLYSKVSYKPDFTSLNGLKVIGHKLLKTRSLNHVFLPNNWLKVYSDPFNPEYFRTWLKMVLVQEDLVISEGYKKHPISKEIGFLSYQYFKLYNYNGVSKITQFKNYQEVMNYDLENNFIDLIIRNESIHKSLIGNANEIGSTPEFVEQLLKENFQKKSNKSKRNDDYKNYYDEETIELVRNKDRLIIEKYDYHFE